MIAKNEYVKINANGKEYTLKNWIYDRYLDTFSSNQTNIRGLDTRGYIENNVDLIGCAIKFDTALEDYKNAILTDFDIMIFKKSSIVTGNEKQVETTYYYNSKQGVEIASYDTLSTEVDLSDYDGRKITAIGFFSANKSGTDMTKDSRPIYACLDTSNYAMRLDASRELNISRKDIMMSNAYCDGYDYPLHLAPVLTDFVDNIRKYTVKIPVLYSVGFGNIKGRMVQEWKIGTEATINRINLNSYGVAMKNPIDVPKYPKTTAFPSSTRYPIAPKYITSIYPKERWLYPSTRRYPMKAGYNYVIFKYRLYYYDNYGAELIWLDEYYTMSYAHNPKGIFTIKNKIERG